MSHSVHDLYSGEVLSLYACVGLQFAPTLSSYNG